LKRLRLLLILIIVGFNILAVCFLRDYEFKKEVIEIHEQRMDQEAEIKAIAKTIIEGKEQEGQKIMKYEVVNRTIAVGAPFGEPVFSWYWSIQWWEETTTTEITIGAWGYIGTLMFWSFVIIFLLCCVKRPKTLRSQNDASP
jgi:hypothetical protein